MYAREVTRLLEGYGTSFDELPHYLQAAVNRINLADWTTKNRKEDEPHGSDQTRANSDYQLQGNSPASYMQPLSE